MYEASIEKPLLERLVAAAEALPIGDPFDQGVRMGPLTTAAQYRKVTSAVERGIRDGTTLLTGGGGRPAGLEGGWFVRPAIVTDVPVETGLWREEIFGPVLAVRSFESEDRAIGLANDSDYGLAAAVWTRDIKKAHRTARRLQAGTVWINTYGLYDSGMPFGGLKQSGYGRELGRQGLLEYTQTKSVWVDLS